MRVLLAFSDTSLGGTSRSAFEFAQLWQNAGAEVTLYAAATPHESRIRQFQNRNIIWIDKISPMVLRDQTLVHIHHAAPNPKTIMWVRALVDMLPDPSPAILTHNIFGQDLGINFPKDKTVIGLLGHWLAQQYKLQNANGSARNRRIVPNPQNLQFFRPPSELERTGARSRLGIQQEAYVVLRVGSPSSEKWAINPYLRLARKVMDRPHMVLRLVGCPLELQRELPVHDRVVVLGPISDDVRLRDEYWAADKFAHWAHRGESFGNVLVEALGTGLPVVYKSRQLRDNTPWEFRDLKGFDYVLTFSDWLGRIVRRTPRQVDEDSPMFLRYSTTHLQSVFSQCVHKVDSAEPGLQATVAIDVLTSILDSPSRLPLVLKAQVLLRHNPFAAWLKVIRWRI